jgi:hypothetical protein
LKRTEYFDSRSHIWKSGRCYTTGAIFPNRQIRNLETPDFQHWLGKANIHEYFSSYFVDAFDIFNMRRNLKICLRNKVIKNWKMKTDTNKQFFSAAACESAEKL